MLSTTGTLINFSRFPLVSRRQFINKWSNLISGFSMMRGSLSKQTITGWMQRLRIINSKQLSRNVFKLFFRRVFNVRRKKLCKTAWPHEKKWEKINANCYLSHVVPWNMCCKPVVMREMLSNILRWFFSPTQRVTPDSGKYHLKCKFSVPARKLMPKRLISKMCERISHGIRTYRPRLLAFSIPSSQLITTCIVTSSLMSGGKLCISRCVSFLLSRL